MPTKPIIVLDTNTLLSAVMRPDSVSAKAFRKALLNGDLVYSPDTFSELIEVFDRPKFDKYVAINERQDFINDFQKAAIPIFTPPLPTPICRDPKDDKYLALALAAKAQYIITGDLDLLILHPFENIDILKSADFLALPI